MSSQPQGRSGMLGGPRIEVPDASAVRRAVLERLRQAIRVGDLPGGTRLLQTQLAEQLGVSRMPVRDAISDLVAEGLATQGPSGGAVVSVLTPDDMRDVYAVRACLEEQAVRIVAADAPEGLVADLRAIVAQAAPMLKGKVAEEATALDREFHWTIYRAAHNRFLEMALTPMWAQVERIMHAVLAMPDYLPTVWDEHAAIIDAIEAGDPDLAARHALGHVHQAADRLIATTEPRV